MRKKNVLTSFGKEVRKETGGFMDPQYMQKILNGSRTSPKTVEALKNILGMEKE